MSERVLTFAELLRQFRERAGLSCNETARAIGVDPSYISRLERSEREPPRRRVVEAVIAALRLGREEADQLLVAAWYAPASVAVLGSWDPALEAVADVLTDPVATAEDLEQFRQVICLVAGRWRGGKRGTP